MSDIANSCKQNMEKRLKSDIGCCAQGSGNRWDFYLCAVLPMTQEGVTSEGA